MCVFLEKTVSKYYTVLSKYNPQLLKSKHLHVIGLLLHNILRHLYRALGTLAPEFPVLGGGGGSMRPGPYAGSMTFLFIIVPIPFLLGPFCLVPNPMFRPQEKKSARCCRFESLSNSVFIPIDPNPAISAHAVFPQSGHIRPEKRPFFQKFPHFSKIKPYKRYETLIGFQYIKLKLTEIPIKCKRNILVLMN